MNLLGRMRAQHSQLACVIWLVATFLQPACAREHTHHLTFSPALCCRDRTIWQLGPGGTFQAWPTYMTAGKLLRIPRNIPHPRPPLPAMQPGTG